MPVMSRPTRCGLGARGERSVCYIPDMTLKAIIHEAEQGGYWAEVPALPGCMTQGETIEDVTLSLREAI